MAYRTSGLRFLCLLPLLLLGFFPAVVGAEAVALETVLSLADVTCQAYEAGLPPAVRTELATTRHRLAAQSPPPQELIDDAVNRLTLSLATGRSFDAVAVAAAPLVTATGGGLPPVNLLAAALQARGDADHAAMLLEYALTVEPDSTRLQLNLAMACLDAGRDDRAKELLDGLVAATPDDPAPWRALAAYWLRRGNRQKALEAMMKAARFGGVVRRTHGPKAEQVRRDEVEEGDSLDTAAAKVARLATVRPTLTADVLEQSAPDAASRLRAEYGMLKDVERLRLPRLPEVNSTSNRAYTEAMPYVGEWMAVVARRQGTFMKDEQFATGIREGDSDAVAEAKARKAGGRFARQQMAQAESMLRMVEGLRGMPGMDELDVDEARRALGEARTKIDGELGPADAEEQRAAAAGPPPMFDDASPLARANYADYTVITGSHERYVRRALEKYFAQQDEILRVYQQKYQAEVENHEAIQAKLDVEHAAGDHGEHDVPCVRERLRHKRALNDIGDTFFKQWAGLFHPQYAQKLKPAFDGWALSAGLYIKAMVHPGVKKREWLRFKGLWLGFAVRLCSAAATGGAFEWKGPTDEEEEALRAALEAAEEAAKAKVPEYERELKTPSIDAMEWIAKYLVLEVAVGALKIKVTAGTIELSATAPGFSGKISYDAINNVMETGFGPGGKFELGVNVGGIEGKVEASVDAFYKTTRWDFDNGTYSEGYHLAKGEVSASLGPAQVGAEASLDAQLVARAAGKATLELPAGAKLDWQSPQFEKQY